MIDTSYLDERLRRDMDMLRERLRRMSEFVLRQLEEAVQAFLKSDRKLAYGVVINDHRIDVYEQHIDRLCQEFLVRHMPVAGQLRFIVAAAKVNSELERIGDYAEAIARRAVTLAEEEHPPEVERIAAMARLSFAMLRNAVEAFLEQDAERAIRTLDSDRDVDRMNASLFTALARVESGATDLTARFALLGVVNRIERVADRACNIAEEAVYVIRGHVLRHRPRHDIRVLFICDHNACRSQMAEALARRIAPSHFIFSSAGAEPTELDPGAVTFLAEKGIDISRQRAKGLGEVGDIEDFHVVVTLSQGAEVACPRVPYGAVALNWSIPDPSLVQGSAEERRAAYKAAYEMLERKIREMTEGLTGAFEREESE
jgi:phosphate transport system protein